MPDIKEDDLFKDSTMSFGDHLEELRICLFRALVGLVIGFIIGLCFGGNVVRIIQSPLQKALISYYEGKSQNDVQKQARSMLERGYGKDILQISHNRALISDRVMVNPYELVYVLGLDPSVVQKSVEGTPISSESRMNEVASDVENPGAENVSGIPETADNTDNTDKTEENSEKHERSVSPAHESVEGDPPALSGSPTGTEVPAPSNGKRDKASGVEENVSESVSRGPEAPWKLADYFSLDSWKNKKKPWESLDVSTDASTVALEEELSHSQHEETLLKEIYIWRPTHSDSRVQTKGLAMQETFIIYVKASLLVGVLIASPWIFWQIWSFIGAGLYPHEKRYVHIFLPFSLLLFLGGAGLAFFFVFEPVLTFLLSFNDWMGIAPDPRISEWLSFFLILPLGFGVSFQLPLVMLFLERIGIISLSAYTSQWRISILVIFIISMILTPADPTSMILMAVPLSFLYLGGIILCRFMPRIRNPYNIE